MPATAIPLIKVIQGYSYSENHKRWYAGGTHTYNSDGTEQQTYSMGSSCICGDPLSDGEPICGPRYEQEYWEIVHVNCCDQHDHSDD